MALEVFDVLHTLDRPVLADRLQMILDQHWPKRRLPVLLEVNVGEEPQKAGVLPDEAEDLARRILDGCPHLQLDGLMAIPPFGRDPEASRPHFKALFHLREVLSQRLGLPLTSLSMGMSHDFDIAIEEGATMVRVGTAIFGEETGTLGGWGPGGRRGKQISKISKAAKPTPTEHGSPLPFQPPAPFLIINASSTLDPNPTSRRPPTKHFGVLASTDTL